MIRVFPRKTKWTPNDELAFVGDPPFSFLREQPFLISADNVYISITFTWDLEEGKRLARAWSDYFPNVKMGGPAMGSWDGDFVPGRFIKKGVTITSRGCPRKCPWCFVPDREGNIRELEIKDGWILQDNNILACSKDHQKRVFEMLQRQPKQIDFNGGLDPRLLHSWHIKEFEKLSVRHFWFSCDTPEVFKPLGKVAVLMSDYKQWQKRCYVLIGWGGETISQAEQRLEMVYSMGFLPFAQLYQGEQKRAWSRDWDRLQRKWCRPAAYRT